MKTQPMGAQSLSTTRLAPVPTPVAPSGPPAHTP